MQHYKTIEAVHLENAWVTIGSFDGVHRGHQTIIQQLVQQAHAHGAPAVVVTFFPHPGVVLGKITNPYYLTTPDERAELLGALGVDAVITMPFTRELAGLSASDFLHILKKHLQFRHLCVGYDFALGRGREGNVDRLRELGTEMEYTLVVIPPVMHADTIISSSEIRRQIQTGRVSQAANLLGRNYSVSGEVIHGDGRGKQLGFPTANIDYWPEQLMPAGGVYATWLNIAGNRYPSVTNLGLRPTFDQGPAYPRLEAHILGIDLNLYGHFVKLEFVEHLRPESRFPDIQALIAQVEKDKQKSLEVLKHAP